MSSTMPRRKPKTRAETKQATRAALIAAGLAEIDGHGLDASLDSICERAGLTRGAFYVHFADRDAFIVAVMEHVLGGFLASLGAIARQPATGVIDMIARYVAAATARAAVVAGGSGLRMQHLLDACRRSRKVGNAYRSLLHTARDQLVVALAADPQVRGDIKPGALANLLLVIGLGVPAMLELELEVDVAGLGSTVALVVSA
jgi:AcrR family transcriptional regulator